MFADKRRKDVSPTYSEVIQRSIIAEILEMDFLLPLSLFFRNAGHSLFGRKFSLVPPLENFSKLSKIIAVFKI